MLTFAKSEAGIVPTVPGTKYGAFSLRQPVFQGGALQSQLRLARADWQEAMLSFNQTVQNALEQVPNSLVDSQSSKLQPLSSKKKSVC